MPLGFEAMPQEKREAVLRAGLEGFAYKPYREVSTEEITHTAGISKGLLFHYFGSKQSFYGVLLRHALARLCAIEWPCVQREGELRIIGRLRGVFMVCERCPLETRLLNMAGRENDAVPQLICGQVLAEYGLLLAPRLAALSKETVFGLRLRKDVGQARAQKLLFTHLHALTIDARKQYANDVDALFTQRDALLQAWNEELLLVIHGIADGNEEEENS